MIKGFIKIDRKHCNVLMKELKPTELKVFVALHMMAKWKYTDSECTTCGRSLRLRPMECIANNTAISRFTSMSRTTVYRAVIGLVESGLVAVIDNIKCHRIIEISDYAIKEKNKSVKIKTRPVAEVKTSHLEYTKKEEVGNEEKGISITEHERPAGTTHKCIARGIARTWMSGLSTGGVKTVNPNDRLLVEKWTSNLEKLQKIDGYDWGCISDLVSSILSDRRGKVRGQWPGWFYCCQSPQKLLSRDKQGRRYFDVIKAQLEDSGTTEASSAKAAFKVLE